MTTLHTKIAEGVEIATHDVGGIQGFLISRIESEQGVMRTIIIDVGEIKREAPKFKLKKGGLKELKKHFVIDESRFEEVE